MLKARPFLKWCGGKTQLLPELLARIPKQWNPETDFYVEPFVGAGALFWELQPKRALLNDANEELYIAWLALDSLYRADLLRALDNLRKPYAIDPEGTYYRWRQLQVNPGDIGVRAARTIFLNKTGFNGLYRVNSKGQFNVPWGKNPNVRFFDEENLRACIETFQTCDVELSRGDFADIPRGILSGALIYCDPPYQPVSKTSNFTSYTAAGFDYYDQLRLALQARVWKDEGCHVILTNSADEMLIDQYRRLGFTCDLVSAKRSVNSKASKRGPVGEYIIY